MKKNIKSIAMLLVFIQLFTMLNLPIMKTYAATDGSDLKVNISSPNKSVVLGKTTHIKVDLNNTNTTDWIYNINISLTLPNGLRYDATDISMVAPSEIKVDPTTKQQTVKWNDIKDLAPNETDFFYIPVKLSTDYIITSTITQSSISFGTQLTGNLTIKGSNDAHRYDTPADMIETPSFVITAMPFEVTANNPGKQLKGAGTTLDESDDYNQYTYSISLINNDKYSSSVSLQDILPNGVQVTSSSIKIDGADVVPDSYDLNDTTTVMFNEISLAAGQTKIITIKSAIFNKTTMGSAVNSGSIIADGQELVSNISYSGSCAQDTYTQVYSGNTTSSVTAKDIIITKSVNTSTGAYNTPLTYTITVRTNEYYPVNSVVVSDTMGDGQAFVNASSDIVTPSVTTSAIMTNYRANMEWDVGLIPEKQIKVFSSSSTIGTVWENNQPIVAGDYILNSARVTGQSTFESYSATPYDADSTRVAIAKPGIDLSLLTINGSSPSGVEPYQVKVGDVLEYRLDYTAQSLDSQQKNVSIIDFFPEGTQPTGAAIYYVNDSIMAWTDPSVGNGANVDSDFISTNDKFKATFNYINRNIKLSVVYKLLVRDSSIITDQKQAYNLAKLSYNNTDGTINSERDQINILYHAPVLSIDKNTNLNTTSASALSAGDSVTFSIDIQNTGEGPAYDVVIRDAVPVEMDNITNISGAGFTLTGNNIEYIIPVIAPGSTVSVKYSAKVISSIGGKKSFKNNASIVSYKKWTGGMSYSEVKTDSVAMQAKAPQFLKTVIDQSRSTLSVGDWVVYELSATASGITLYNTTITDVFPNGQSISASAIFSSYDTTAKSGTPYDSSKLTIAGRNLTISGIGTSGTLANSSHKVYVKAQITSTTATQTNTEKQTNTATLTWEDKATGGTKWTASDTEAVYVRVPTLTASWTPAGPISMVTGQTQTYVFQITNSNSNTSKAHNFSPFITMPEGFSASYTGSTEAALTLISNTTSGGIRTLKFSETDLDANQKIQIGITVTLDRQQAAGLSQDIKGYTGAYYTTEANYLTRASITSTTSVRSPNVTITKAVESTTNGDSLTNLRPGDEVVFNVNLTVSKGTEVFQLKMNDILPSQLIFESFTYNGTEHTNASDLPFLISNHEDAVSDNITYDIKVKAKASTTYNYGTSTSTDVTNTAIVMWNMQDNASSTSASAIESITIVQPKMNVDSFITTNGDITFNSAGQKIYFAGSVSNSGINTAYNVKVIAKIPTNTAINVEASDISNGGTYDSTLRTITWTIPTLSASAIQNLSFSLTEDGDLSTRSDGRISFLIEEYFSTPNAGAKQYSQVGPLNIDLNEPPKVQANYNFTILEDSTTGGAIVANDANGDSLTYSLTQNVSFGAITLNDSTGAWTYNPGSNNFGSVYFIVSISDSKGGVAQSRVDINVLPVNDQPSFTRGLDITVLQNSGPYVGEWAQSPYAGAGNEGSQTLTYEIVSITGSGEIFSTLPVISNGGAITPGAITFTPANNVIGTATLNIRLKDDGGTDNGGIDTSATIQCVITIKYVNQVPSFTKGSDVTIITNNGPQTLTGWATNIKPGPAIENYQITHFEVTSVSNSALFLTPPAISANGTLTFTPSPGAIGVSTVTLLIKDNGGTADGGVDISATQTFNITINPVPPPVPVPVQPLPGLTVPDYSYQTKINAPVSNKVVATSTQANMPLSYSLNANPLHGSVSVASDGKWAYTPTKDYVGTDMFTIKVVDSNGTVATSYIKITVKNGLTFKLLGTVREKETRNTIKDTTIKLYDSKGKLIVTKVTDSTGKYDFGEVAEDVYSIIATNDLYAQNQRYIEAKQDNAVNGVITADIDLVGFDISLVANPSSIIGDGIDETVLTSTIKDRYGRPLAGVTVNFDAATGIFYEGKTAVTDKSGVATVPYRSIKIEGTVGKKIPVTATVVDHARGLYARDQIIITFEPGTIKGVVIDNATGKPVEGAIVEVAKDFNRDGVIDFYAKQTTLADGKYKIAIPKGNVSYDIKITKSVKLDGKEKEVTFLQQVKAGKITGHGNEVFKSNIVGVGSVSLIKPDGSQAVIMDTAKLRLQVFHENGAIIKGKTSALSKSGTFSIPNLEEGKNYQFKVMYKLPNGSEISIGEVKVKLSQDGEMNISQILVDPYGKVYEAVSKVPIEGATVKLFYANTDRNKKNGNTPGKQVVLPNIPDFPPNQNKNPQISDANGEYAYMVFPYTDYYLTAEKVGYTKYTSSVIKVEGSIVKHDIEMKPLKNASKDKDVAVYIEADNTKYEEGTTATFTLKYFNKSQQSVNNSMVSVVLPKGLTAATAKGGTIKAKTITWNLGALKPGAKGQLVFTAKIDKMTTAENILKIPATITSKEKLINLADDTSRIDILGYSNRFVHKHERYIKGYPDYTFKPDRSITRAEVAAIFARILKLQDKITKNKIYNDVPTNFWAADYIQTTTQMGLFTIGKDKKFRPNDAITRGELAIVIAKYLKLTTDNSVKPMETHFTDISNNACYNAVEQLYRFKIIDLSANGKFRPNDKIKRTEAVSMINRLLFRGPLNNVNNTFPDMTKKSSYFGDSEEAIRTHESIINPDGTESLTKYIPEPLW